LVSPSLDIIQEAVVSFRVLILPRPRFLLRRLVNQITRLNVVTAQVPQCADIAFQTAWDWGGDELLEATVEAGVGRGGFDELLPHGSFCTKSSIELHVNFEREAKHWQDEVVHEKSDKTARQSEFPLPTKATKVA